LVKTQNALAACEGVSEKSSNGSARSDEIGTSRGRPIYRAPVPPPHKGRGLGEGWKNPDRTNPKNVVRALVKPERAKEAE